LNTKKENFKPELLLCDEPEELEDENIPNFSTFCTVHTYVKKDDICGCPICRNGVIDYEEILYNKIKPFRRFN